MIPRTMSTQHPDNVRQPFFCNSNVFDWEDEIKEAFYVFSHLKCREQLWDYEGKEVDNFVVKKLLAKYEAFFRRKKPGVDVRLTYRVPNPAVEKNDAKVLLETLMSIARSADTATFFYGERVTPVFEVALPMCSSATEAIKVKQFYRDYISKIEENLIIDQKIKEWVGEIEPKDIKVIPLVETKEAIINAGKIAGEYLEKTKEEEMRFWIARSDPALNYSSTAAVLLVKLALDRLREVSIEQSKTIYPILGCGSAPFRGNFKPSNCDHILKGYPSVHTFTIQSSFKYDNDEEEVRAAIDKIENTPTGQPIAVDESRIIPIIEKIIAQYEKEIVLVADNANRMSVYIPKRRMRKLHVGLFGYSRKSRIGIVLPRAIRFCAALYSYGFPPEILGLSALNQKDIEEIVEVYPNFLNDIKTALPFLNKENLKYFPHQLKTNIEHAIATLDVDYEENYAHNKITSIIMKNMERQLEVEEDILRAAWVRGFLG
ncbi:MAG: phosphoenolpyruvate carboxylase [Candidatus Bilamarchaeaceae archaeon]